MSYSSLVCDLSIEEKAFAFHGEVAQFPSVESSRCLRRGQNTYRQNYTNAMPLFCQGHMLVQKGLPRCNLRDFCDLEDWYPDKGSMKDIMMGWMENPEEWIESPEKDCRIPNLVDCNRGILEDEKNCHWFATLSPDQYSEGHTIVVSSKHLFDVTDEKCREHVDVVKEFWWGVHRCAKRLKKALGAEKIYVASLCDGVEHLHVHLIPRYQSDRTGFGFMGEREQLYNEGTLHICAKSVPLKKEWLQNLSELIRKS